MKILFIAPIPPPINGQSKASKVILDALQENHQVQVINLSKNSLKNGEGSLARIKDIFNIAKEVRKSYKKNDIVFLSLAESFAGNLRDLLIYNIISKKISKTYIQMLGGAGMKEILHGTGWQKKANAKFMEKIGGVIVEGPANFESFRKVVSEEKIHIVPNFAEDFLFANTDEIEKKFENVNPIKVLFLSNLIPGKGYNELADAFLSLSAEEQSKLRVTFVGGFESAKDEESFLTKISQNNNLEYLGKFIDGEKKRNLYIESHVFCLPTYYPFEGQPISILEGYATGCVVITSDHSGIPYVFRDNFNGFLVEKKSVISLAKALRRLLSEKEDLKKIAINNRDEALEKYRTEIYQKKILQILENQK